MSALLFGTQKEELEEKIKIRQGLEVNGAVNSSWKVYRMYREIIRFLDDPQSEWEYCQPEPTMR